MRRYVGVVVLCGLLVIPVFLFARAPSPQPRFNSAFEGSAVAAERLLIKQYGTTSKGIKDAKVRLMLLTREATNASTNGEDRNLFAIAAAKVIYSGDGLVTFKNARYVSYHVCPSIVDGVKRISQCKWTNTTFATIRFQFFGSVRRLQDILKFQLKYIRIENGFHVFEHPQIELITNSGSPSDEPHVLLGADPEWKK